ncbi:hypothetical protein B0H19DRAFT_1069404 [Mycena capillaripes]|nr:hypothetical protein B0H19DRAFT_1069404 [Mycena capillaripes]
MCAMGDVGFNVPSQITCGQILEVVAEIAKKTQSYVSQGSAGEMAQAQARPKPGLLSPTQARPEVGPSRAQGRAQDFEDPRPRLEPGPDSRKNIYRVKPGLKPKPDPTLVLPEGFGQAQNILEPKPSPARPKPDPTPTSLPTDPSDTSPREPSSWTLAGAPALCWPVHEKRAAVPKRHLFAFVMITLLRFLTFLPAPHLGLCSVPSVAMALTVDHGLLVVM